MRRLSASASSWIGLPNGLSSVSARRAAISSRKLASSASGSSGSLVSKQVRPFGSSGSGRASAAGAPSGSRPGSRTILVAMALPPAWVDWRKA